MRDDRVTLRMSAAMHSDAAETAEGVGLNLATWLRMRALEAASPGKRKLPKNDNAGDGPPVTIRFTPLQGKLVRAAAAEAGVSVGEYIRRAAAK